MFATAFKSLSSNITSNYTLAPQPSSQAGPWDVFDATRKSTGKPASVFVFDRKSLDPSRGSGGAASLGGRGGTASLRKAHDEIAERLKQEAGNLARLRHPNILEFAEPVEETRSGGLMFATEPVTASLGALLRDKDSQEQNGGSRNTSRYRVQHTEQGSKTSKTRDWELDELEIQKGLLQLGKGLEFLHESAGLVHANLTPEAIIVNAKGDWKIAGLAFCGPHPNSTAATSLPPLSLYEALTYDPRLPRTVQLNLDYTSPDFVMDNSLTPSADIFSLGLVILALYNSPHASPLSTGNSQSTYKRFFASSSTLPTRRNNYLLESNAVKKLSNRLADELLPSLITRRPAQRLNATAFQQAPYFDNVLVSTLRFLESFPAKSSTEKAQFLRGLPRILPQFPAHVLERKLLPTLLEETKDRDLLPPVLGCVFKAVEGLPTTEEGKETFASTVVPKLRTVFLSPAPSTNKAGPAPERDTSKDPAIIIILANMTLICNHCTGASFNADILPIVLLALESPTHAVVDAALKSLNPILAVLDFSTMRHKLFPAIAMVFAKTSSLSIKICALEALGTLCGGSPTENDNDDGDDGLMGLTSKPTSKTAPTAILDKHTIQEKLVPLLKAMRTKEPAVMMAALRVFRCVGGIADPEFVAVDVLPTLWAMALGPLLDLSQFQAFMTLIKKLGKKIEDEQIRKLKSLGTENGTGAARGLKTGLNSGPGSASAMRGMSGNEDVDFESLVSGRKANASADGGLDLMNDWSAPAAAAPRAPATQSSQFAWQSSSPSMSSAMRPQSTTASRTITPDQSLNSFASLTPSSQFSQPLQPTSGRPTNGMSGSMSNIPMRQQIQPQTQPTKSTNIDWSAASKPATPSWSLPPPPTSPPLQSPQTQMQNRQWNPPKAASGGAGSTNNGNSNGGGGGLDKYESLI